MNDNVTLIDVLKNPDQFDWRYALYLPTENWSLTTRALVLDPDDVDNPEDPDDDPILAKQAGFKYVLMMQDVDSILQNALAQNPSLPDDELLLAFNYFMNNDAFINFDK